MTQLQFKVKPYAHQLEILEKTKDKEYWAIFAEMGLGKSAIALVQAAYLYNDSKIKQVLIVTKNGVDQQFIEEAVPQHLPLLPEQYFTDCWRDYDGQWAKYNKFKDHLDNKLTIVGINCEALGTKKGYAAIIDFAKRRPTLLVVDESQEFAGIDSKRTQNLLQIAGAGGNLFPYRRIMTGTPTGGNPLHYYAQMQILSASIFPMSKWSFEYLYCVKEAHRIWVKDKKTGTAKLKRIETTTGYKNLDKLQAVVAQYSSRKTKDECLDLPPKVYKKITFKLSDEEQSLYNKVKNSTLIELAPGKYIDADMAIKKLIRLQQVACGFVGYEDLVTGERAKSLLANPSRIQRLMEWTQLVAGKAIVWASFTTSVDQVVDEIKKNYGEESVVRYDGMVGSSERHINKINFKTNDKVRFFVGHPGAGGVGVDIPEAEDTAYYSNGPKLITRLQSEDRNHRIGTKRTVVYSDFVAENTVDVKVLTALRSRFDIATQLTGDELKKWIS